MCEDSCPISKRDAAVAAQARADVLKEKFDEMRNVINVDVSGLAFSLSKIREVAKGYRWIPDNEWGSYDYTQRTTETLQKEVGYLLDEIERLSYEGLRDSGNRVIARVKEVDESLRQPQENTGSIGGEE
jgi:hypothetical protein